MVVDASPGGQIKKVYLVSKTLYEIGSSVYVCVRVWVQGGFVGVGTAYIVNKLCDEIEKRSD